MGGKCAARAQAADIQKAPIKLGFITPLMNGLPFAFGKPITIGATAHGCAARRPTRVRSDNDVREMGNAGHSLLRLNEGVGEHVRTKSHRLRRSR